MDEQKVKVDSTAVHESNFASSCSNNLLQALCWLLVDSHAGESSFEHQPHSPIDDGTEEEKKRDRFVDLKQVDT